MPNPSPEEFSKVESELLARVSAAKDRYDEAKAKVDTLLQVQQDLGLGHADGRQAALKAARMEREAVQGYADALRDFTDFILTKRREAGSTEK